ncbi:MAG: TetR/AcrR family transcriptional regulator [Pseudomonadota bacterium]
MSTSASRTATAKKRAPAPKTPSKTLPKKTSDRSSTPSPAKTYHHGNLRESLLLAAEDVLAAQGVHGTTLRDVAKTAGVSHAAPYHHFASLNDLLAAVAERGFIALGDAMEQATAQANTRERLLQIAQAYVSCARAQPARFRLMFAPQLTQGGLYPALQAASHRAFGFLMAAACAHDPVKGPELALCGWSLSHGLSNLLIDGAFDTLPQPVSDPDALVRQLAARALGPI